MSHIDSEQSRDESITSLLLQNVFQRIPRRIKTWVNFQGHSNWFDDMQVLFQMDLKISKLRAMLTAASVAVVAYKGLCSWVAPWVWFLFFFLLFFIYILGDVWMYVVYVWVYARVWALVYTHLTIYVPIEARGWARHGGKRLYSQHSWSQRQEISMSLRPSRSTRQVQDS